MPFGVLSKKNFNIIWLSNLFILSISDEDCYSRKALCTKIDIYNVISNNILDHPVYFQSNQSGITRGVSLKYQILKTQHVNGI